MTIPPFTSSLESGAVVPIPTLPPEFITATVPLAKVLLLTTNSIPLPIFPWTTA